jgi:hypothetical protein
LPIQPAHVGGHCRLSLQGGFDGTRDTITPSGEQEVIGTGRKPERDAAEDNRFRFASFIEKLVLLALGFALTTAAGAYLSNQFRIESTRAQLQITAMDSEITRVTQVFEAISQLMDKRLFRMRRVHDVFSGAAGEEREQRLAEYRTVFIEWNDNLNRYRALFAMYFQPNADELACKKSFEGIALKFAQAHRELQKLIGHTEVNSVENLKHSLDELNICVYSLDSFMLAQINARRADYQNKISNH